MIASGLGYLEAIFGWLLAASWQAAVLALLVLLVQTLLRNRLNPRWRYALWLLVLARLLLPALPESTLSLFQFAPPPPPALVVPVTTSLFVEAPPSLPALPLSTSAPLPEPAHPFSLYSLLALIWLTGAVCLFVLTWQVNRRFARQVAASPEITDPDLRALFAQTQIELNLRRTIRLIESPHVQSPAIMGLFSPTLLLPANVRAEFDRTELRLIFLHELAHLKRGDIIAQGLIAFLQILHWFNPVLWFAFRRMRADREPATDALVLSRAGESEKERYGLMLIKLLENFNQRHSLPTLVGILEDKDQFKRRFSLIARFTCGAYGWSLLGVLLIGILSITCLTRSKAAVSSASSPAPVITQTQPPPPAMKIGPPAMVRVALRVMQLDEADYQIHRADVDAAVQKGDYQTLSQLKSCRLISEPAVLTRSGEQGVLEAVRVMPVPIKFEKDANGKLTATDFKKQNVGVRFVLLPKFADGKIELTGNLTVSSFEGWIQAEDLTQRPTFHIRTAPVSESFAFDQSKGFEMPGGAQMEQDDPTAVPSPDHSLDESQNSRALRRIFFFVTTAAYDQVGHHLPAPSDANASSSQSAADGEEPLTVRTFLVPDGFFKTPPDPSTTTVDVKPELTEKGITFPAGSRVTFFLGPRKLVMRNTPTQLDKTADLFPATPDSAPVSSWSPADLALLVKNYKDPTTGTDVANQKPANFAHITTRFFYLSEDEYQAHRAEIDAAVQKGDFAYLSTLKSFDLISEPSVLTKSGERGVIESVRVLPVPGKLEKDADGKTITLDNPRQYLGIRFVVKPIITGANVKVDGSAEVTSLEKWTRQTDGTYQPTIHFHNAPVSQSFTSDQTWWGVQLSGGAQMESADPTFYFPSDQVPDPSKNPKVLRRAFFLLNARIDPSSLIKFPPFSSLNQLGHLISTEGIFELSPDTSKTLSLGNPKEPVTFQIRDGQLSLTRKAPQGGLSLPLTHNGWIIYANATSTLWFYDGWRQIQSIRLQSDGIRPSPLSSQQPDIWPLAPPLFLAAIEKARQEKAKTQTNNAGATEPSIPWNSLTVTQTAETQAQLDKLGVVYDMDMAEALIEGRNDIIKRQYARGNSHCSALTYAISQGASVAEVQAMLKNGTSIQVEKDEVLSPLCMAVIKGDLPLVTLLIEHGADPQWRGQGNIIDLDAMSLALSNPDIVAYLLDHGVRAEFKDLQFAVVSLDPDRSTPLRAKEKETVRLLLDHGALDQQPPLPSVTKGDLLRIACLNARDIEVVKWLLAHGCDPGQRDLLKKKTVLEWVRDASEGKNNWPIYPEFKPILALLEAAGKTTSTDTGKTSSLLEIDDTGTNASSPSPAQAEFQRKASAIMVHIDFGRKSIIDVLKSVQADAARQGFVFSLDLSKLDPRTPPLIYNYGHSASVDNALQIIGDDVGLKVEALPNGQGYRISYDELKHKAQQTYIDVDFKNVDAITALKTVQSEAAKQGFVFNLDLTAVNELPDLPLTAKGADLTVAETITAICWRANLSALPQENSRSYRIVVKDPFITGGSEPGQLITPEGTFAIPSGSLQTFNLGNPKEPVQFRYDKGVLSMVRRPLFGSLDLRIGHRGWKVYADSSEVVWAYNGNGRINRLQFHSREFAQEIVEYADYSPLDKTLWAQAPGRFLALIGKNRAGQDVSPHSPTPEEADPDSALISAVKTNDVMTLVALLRDGVIYDAPSHPSAPTPLFLTNNHTVATLLIARGIDVHTRNDLGMTALHQVCSTRDPEAAETALVLLQHGANPNATDNQGRTPLMIAGNGPCAEPLLEHGAKR